MHDTQNLPTLQLGHPPVVLTFPLPPPPSPRQFRELIADDLAHGAFTEHPISKLWRSANLVASHLQENWPWPDD